MSSSSNEAELPSSRQAFASLRFDGKIQAYAEQLRAALLRRGADLRIVDMRGRGDIDHAVIQGIEAADFFIVFGSAKYGEDTGNPASTYFESKFAQKMKKKIILLRMIPFDEEFEFPRARFMFGINMLELVWMLGTPMPAELPELVLDAMGLAGRGEVAALITTVAKADARAGVGEDELRGESSNAAAPITTVAGAAAAAGVDEDELLGYSRDDLRELFKELGVGVVARNTLLRQSEEAATARLAALRASSDPAEVTAALQAFRGRDGTPEYAALVAYARGEELAAKGALEALRAGASVASLEALCDLLWRDGKFDAPHQTALGALGAGAALVAVVREAGGDASLVEWGCRALGRLVGDHPANQTAAAAAGGIEAVVAAMRAHPGAEGVQKWGCNALGNLVNDHPANQTAAAGGIEAVAAAMRVYPGAEGVQEMGCYALGNLVRSHPANKTAAAAAGAIEAVAAAMRAHPGAEGVQEMGCYTLRTLVRSHPTNKAAVKRAGAIKLAEAACAHYAAGTEAHKDASSLLKLLKY